MELSKAKVVGIVVVLIAVVAGGFFLSGTFSKKNKNDYSVVYLESGEIYVGKIARFPRLKMTSGYLLSNTRDPRDPAKTNLQLIPLSESAWAPVELYLDLSHILFYGPLSDDSGAAKALAAKAKKTDKVEAEKEVKAQDEEKVENTDTEKEVK